jgi:two-component system chemotaxis response regulator CheB
MPEVDGVEVLRRLRAGGVPAGAIMLSSLTAQGAQTTMTCLELGAFDFVLKPAEGNMEANIERLRGALRPRLAAFARRHNVRALLGGASPAAARPPGAAPVAPAKPPERAAAPSPTARCEVVAIGISTGGPKALTEMLPRLPADLPVPVLIVQHMPPVFTKSLADDLDRRCRLRVCVAQDGCPVRAGQVFIAPGGKQMKVCRESEQAVLRITDDPPENSCRPSVDYLFRSVVNVYGGNTVGVIMTGMGNDGALGCRWLKARGGRIIAQDEPSCVVFGMPRQPIEEGVADLVSPLDSIAAEIVRAVERNRAACR